jgi:hypothetical protein
MRFVAAGCLALVALAACSDTPVSPNALRSQAAHFDSLATAVGQPHPADPTRVANLELIANALAHGALPGVTTMTIAGQSVTVHIVGVEALYTDTSDIHVWAVAWVDPDADTSITVTGIQLLSGFIDQTVALVVGDSSEWTQSYPPQFTYREQGNNTACTNYPITNRLGGPNPQCQLVLATVSFSAVPGTFEGSPLLLPTGAAIASPSVTFGVARLAGAF